MRKLNNMMCKQTIRSRGGVCVCKRTEARKAKAEYKTQGFDAKIIQRKWEMTKEVEVR